MVRPTMEDVKRRRELLAKRKPRSQGYTKAFTRLQDDLHDVLARETKYRRKRRK